MDKIPPSPHREGRNRLAAPAYNTTKPQWEVTYLGWGQPSSRSRTAVFVPPVASPPLPPIDGPPILGLEESEYRQPIDNLIAPEDPSSSEEDDTDLYGIAFDASAIEDNTWEY